MADEKRIDAATGTISFGSTAAVLVDGVAPTR